MSRLEPLNIWTMFDRAVEQHPDRIAVVDRGSRITYSELHRRIAGLTHFLRAESIGAGDRLSILELNSLEFYIAYYAAAALGAVLNPLNYRLSNRELAFILRDSGSRWLLVSTEFQPQVETISNETALEGILWLGEETAASSAIAGGTRSVALGEIPDPGSGLTPTIVDPDRPAHLYYTSGTTGRPKGVILTHRNVCRHAEGAVAELDLGPDDHWGHMAPMFHLADAWAVFAITLVGGRHVMLPRFDAQAALRTIAREKVTISNLIPTMLNLMVTSPEVRQYDLSSLRVILSGGAPIALDVVRKIIDTFGCDYVQTYGMTETSPYLTLSLLKDHLKLLPLEDQLRYKAKTGRPFVTVELKVMREDGCSEVSQDESEVGEIWVRGETVTPGYWNRPEETRENFAGDWLRTGDLAVVDQEGYVNIVDRKKDMILTGGENVYSIEVESVLYEHPKVLEAAVIGTPDETWGEIVEAAVVLKPGKSASAEDLIAFCKSRLAAFKAPQSIVFIRELPKTGSGKISKMALRDQLARRSAPGEDL
jgi:acyl-CoA synthetase (AMP-forming)/AMP-acid ligase II